MVVNRDDDVTPVVREGEENINSDPTRADPSRSATGGAAAEKISRGRGQR
jgi:hypothetical protein